jgi:hypothetical protein
MSKTKAEEIALVPKPEFQDAVRKILSNSKQRSDKDLAKFRASNAVKREANK